MLRILNGKTLEQKKDRLQVERKVISGTDFEVMAETILRGHENWITDACWFVEEGETRLATCSMDKSIIIWRAREGENEVWEDWTHLGAVGGGNMGFLGIVTGKDREGNQGILSHSYTGSMHLWWCKEEKWCSSPAPSGHYGSVRDLAWSNSFLLSTSYDQTTRLYAKVLMIMNRYVSGISDKFSEH